MEKFVKLGKYSVCRLGLGTYGFGEAYGNKVSKEGALQVLRSMSDRLPVNKFFLLDTAPLYGSGKCEEWIGEFLKGEPSNVLVATKGGRRTGWLDFNKRDFSAKFLERDLDNSLKRLGVDSVFLYQLHGPSFMDFNKGLFDVLERFRAEGKIEHYGVSVDRPIDARAALRFATGGYSGLLNVQCIYNVLNKSFEHIFVEAKKAGVCVFAREPLMRGFLPGRHWSNVSLKKVPAVKKMVDLYGERQILMNVERFWRIISSNAIRGFTSQVALSFVLSNPGVSVVLCGSNNPDYLDSNMGALDVELPVSVIEELNSMVDLVEKKIIINSQDMGAKSGNIPSKEYIDFFERHLADKTKIKGERIVRADFSQPPSNSSKCD